IHDKVIALDTHVDIEPDDFTAERNYAQRLAGQVDLPKMTDGGLDAVFMVVYVGQPSLQTTPDAFEPSRYERRRPPAGPLGAERLRARVQVRGREVRIDPSADGEDRARQDRARPHSRRRPQD